MLYTHSEVNRANVRPPVSDPLPEQGAGGRAVLDSSALRCRWLELHKIRATGDSCAHTHTHTYTHMHIPMHTHSHMHTYIEREQVGELFRTEQWVVLE